MQIEEFIPVGMANAVSREELSHWTGLSDRKVRSEIAEARKRCVIINLQNGAGYFRPLPEEYRTVKDHYDQENDRAMSVLVALKLEHAWLDDVSKGRTPTC